MTIYWSQNEGYSMCQIAKKLKISYKGSKENRKKNYGMFF